MEVAVRDSRVRVMHTSMIWHSSTFAVVEWSAASRLFPNLGYRGGMCEVVSFSSIILYLSNQIHFPSFRLTSRVSQLELELERSRSSAQSREQELLKEIGALKLSLCQRSSASAVRAEGTCSPPDHQGPYHAHSAQPLDDGIDAEQNMELATPLQPTTVLSWDNLSLTPPNDSLISRLPLSPERNSSPIIPPSRPVPRPSSPHPVKLKRLEEGLEVARDQPTEDQLTLGQLKNDMEELQRLLTDKPP